MLLILDLSCLIAYGNPLSLFEFRLQKICYLSPLPLLPLWGDRLWRRGTEVEDKTNLFALTKGDRRRIEY